MTAVLLDTTFLIDVERRAADVDAALAADDDVAVAAITVAELLVGVELAPQAVAATRGAFVRDVIETIPVIDYDLRVARAHAQLLAAARRAGRPRGAHDLIIAATARATGRRLVTAHAAGFTHLPGVDVIGYRT